MATIFEQRQEQIAALTPRTTAQEVRQRRIAARRQVLEAFRLLPPSQTGTGTSNGGASVSQITGDSGVGGVTDTGGDVFSPSQRSSNLNADFTTSLAIGLTSLDEQIATPREAVGFLAGLAALGPLGALVAQGAASLGAQANAPVGSLFSSPVTDFFGRANVVTTTGLQTVDTGRQSGLTRTQSFDAPTGTGFGSGGIAADQGVGTVTQSGTPGLTREQSFDRPGFGGGDGGVGGGSSDSSPGGPGGGNEAGAASGGR